MDLTSQSWEYASEMVLKSVHMELRTAEVPVRFLKDREGRESHHKRAGWSSPWKAAWINLRAMFVYGADFFVLKPGLVLLALGLLLTLPLSFGPVTIGADHVLAVLDARGHDAHRRRASVLLPRVHRPDRSTTTRARPASAGSASSRTREPSLLSAGAFLLGVVLTVPLVVDYVRSGLELPGEPGAVHHLAVTGLLAMIVGFTTFAFTLVVHAAAMTSSERDGRAL